MQEAVVELRELAAAFLFSIPRAVRRKADDA
jgi:hypothetical protein